jgi:hypothetical protein
MGNETKTERAGGRDEGDGGSDADGEENPAERRNRELIELLNELRVALPGVQVLFAFLLTVPFSQRFTEIDAADKRLYFVAVLSTAVATLLFIAPTAHHRIRFREGVKESLLRVANVFVVIGLVLLAVAITSVTFLVTDLVYPGNLPASLAAFLAAAFAVVWFVLPFVYRRRGTPGHYEDRDGPPAAGQM